MTGIAFVGTGFVADYYFATLPNHPELKFVGAFDRMEGELDRFCRYYNVRKFASLNELLADPQVDIVVNLTTIESHHEVSTTIVEAGKHLYSEKPLTLDYQAAADLLEHARQRGVLVATAPANALTPMHETVSSLIAAGAIGAPKLVYAEMEDGAVFRHNWRDWRSKSGAKWPGEHEFVVGCTLEHAVYALAWLVSLLGPAKSMTAFSALCFPQKGVTASIPLGPDFSVAVLNFHNGAVARLTSGLSAPKDRALTIMGESGTITVDDLWDYHSPARIERSDDLPTLWQKIAGQIEWRLGLTPGRIARHGRPIQAPGASKPTLPHFPSKIDFAAGVAALARAIDGGPMPFMSGKMALHVTEIVLAISNAGAQGGHVEFRTRP